MPEQTTLLMLPRSEVATRVLKEIARSLSVSISIGAGEQEQQAVEWEFGLCVHHYAEEEIVFGSKRGPVEISLRGACNLAGLLTEIESKLFRTDCFSSALAYGNAYWNWSLRLSGKAARAIER